MAQGAFDELKWRGLIYDVTENVDTMLAGGPVAAYNGFEQKTDQLRYLGMILYKDRFYGGLFQKRSGFLRDALPVGLGHQELCGVGQDARLRDQRSMQ